jgi:hypothetical protein
MTTIQIKSAILEGKNLGNEVAEWYTLCKPSDNRYMISIKGRILLYKNINSAAKRISQLIKRGY